VAGLVRKLDELAAAKKELKVVVNFIDVAQSEVAKFAQDNGVRNVSLATTDQKNAERFKVNPEAGVTIMNYLDKKVKSNHAVAVGKLEDKTIAAIVESASELLSAKK